MDQCVEQIEAEPDGDDQSDDRFTHRLRLLKLAQGEGVDAHQRQHRKTEHHERDVEHDRLLAGALLNADPRKLSIANWAAGRKDFISLGAAGNCAPGAALRADVARKVRSRQKAQRSERPPMARAGMFRIVCTRRRTAYIMCALLPPPLKRLPLRLHALNQSGPVGLC
jgi:hypothetical protein